MRFPLQGAVLLETSHISLDDRFAAQIVYATGRCPPIFRLPSTDSFLSFQFFGFEITRSHLCCRGVLAPLAKPRLSALAPLQDLAFHS